MPSEEKLIVVLGATGNQGGSVARTFLREPSWRVRAVTRSPHSEKSKQLSNLGAEVFVADLDDPQSLVASFSRAHAIFAVSDFTSIYFGLVESGKSFEKPANVVAAEREDQQLRNAIDAAAQISSLERFVVSGLSDATKWSGGRYQNVQHFDSKARAIEYGATRHPKLWSKTSIFQAGWFLNMLNAPGLEPVKGPDGVFRFILPIQSHVKMPLIVPEEDSGPFVLSLIKETPGKNLIAYREWLTPVEMAEAFTTATGFASEALTQKLHLSLPPDFEAEVDENWAYWNEFGYEGRADKTVIHPHNLRTLPSMPGVGDWFKKQLWYD